MMRRAKTQAKASPSADSPPIDRGRTSRAALVAAAVLALASALHFILSQRPYPDRLPWLWITVGNPILLVCVFASDANPRWIADLPGRALSLLLKPPTAVFATGIAVFACGASVLVAYHVFDRLPTTADEIAQLWHARILLEGRLSLPVDPNPEFFAIDNVVDQGRWYSEYPVGGPAVLAIGVLLGAPWIINPLLGGATAFALYQFARRVYSEGEARAAGVLFCVTPMAFMMAGSHMNHVPVLFLAVCSLIALAVWDATQSARTSMIAATAVGLLIGFMATIRPLDAVVVAICVGVFQLTAVARDRARARSLVFQAGGGIVAIAPLLYANWRTTGAPFRFGYEVLWGEAHGMGFHADPSGGVHTFARALEYATSYVSDLNVYALVWPTPILAIAFVALLSMKRVTRWDALLFGLFATQVVAYALYWHKGQFIGPRFLYTALPSVILLVARSPFLIGERFGPHWRRVAVMATFAWGIFALTAVPHRYSVWGRARSVRDGRRAIKTDVPRALKEAGLHNALVFLREPVGNRLMHRLWGLGIPRTEAATFLRNYDACSLLDAMRILEADTTKDRNGRLEFLHRTVMPYVVSDTIIRSPDGIVHISSPASLTPACDREFSEDQQRGSATFGPAMWHEPITSDGRIDGDVVFVADLGERNETLRARFRSRTWYRLTVARHEDDSRIPLFEPY